MISPSRLAMPTLYHTCMPDVRMYELRTYGYRFSCLPQAREQFAATPLHLEWSHTWHTRRIFCAVDMLVCSYFFCGQPCRESGYEFPSEIPVVWRIQSYSNRSEFTNSWRIQRYPVLVLRNVKGLCADTHRLTMNDNERVNRINAFPSINSPRTYVLKPFVYWCYIVV